MRRLAHLYARFSQGGKNETFYSNLLDMFRRQNFSRFVQAVEVYTQVYYLIKTSVNIAKANFLVHNEENHARHMDDFICVLELFKDRVFGDATYQLNKDRQIRLRKPAALPLQEDVQKVRIYILNKMKYIVERSFEFIDIQVFINLRNLVCARLTLFNARRGGEPPRLFLAEWEDADSSAWISQHHLSALEDEIDRKLAKNTKITYQSGKGNYFR